MRALSHPWIVAALWLVVAVLSVAAVVGEGERLALEGAFFQAMPQPEVARGLFLVGALAALGGLAMALRRWGRSQGIDARSRDYEMDLGAFVRPGRLAVLAMGLGALLMIGDWASSHRYVPAGAMTAPLGQALESVPVEQGARSLEAMLPLRTSAHFMDVGGAQPEVSLQFARPSNFQSRPDKDSIPRLALGQSIDVEDRRISFSALNHDVPQFQAHLRVEGEDQSRVVTIGEEIRVGDAQRRLRVVDGTSHYLEGLALAPGVSPAEAQLMLLRQQYPMEAIGPALKLEDDSGDSFWIFERDPGMTAHAEYAGVSIELERLEQVPAPVFTVVPIQWRGVFWLGLLLFGLGFVVWFMESRHRGGWDGWVEERGQDDSSAGGIALWAPAVVAAMAPAIAVAVGGSSSTILALAALVPLGVLPLSLHEKGKRRWDEPLSRMILVGVAIMAVMAVTFGGPVAVGAPDIRNALWVAQSGGWLAMGVGFLAALWCLVAPRRGAHRAHHFVAASVVLGAAATMALLAYQRGDAIVSGLALPVASDGETAVWTLEGVMAAQGLALPVLVESSLLAVAVALMAAGALATMHGVWHEQKPVLIGGWVTSLVGGGVSLYKTLGLHGVEPVSAEVYEQVARRWFRARQLPTELADMGHFVPEQGWSIDVSQLGVELGLMAAVAVLSLLMAVKAIRETSRPWSDLNDGAARRTALVWGLAFGVLGFASGQLLTWLLQGSLGVLGPMEWLAVGALALGAAVAMISWRDDRAVAPLVMVLGTVMVLCYLLIAGGLGAANGAILGGSIPL